MEHASHEVRFTLPSIEVAAKVWGKPDGLPVIGLHGWLDNAATFDLIAPDLDGVYLVALDLPGHGLSGHLPAGGYSLWQQAATVLQVVESMGWDRFALLGHSMGAIISSILSASVPDRILGAALIDGLMPITSNADDTPAQMARFLEASLATSKKRKPVYVSPEKATTARILGGSMPLSRAAASCLVERGLMPEQGGWTWRTDPQLMLPSALRFTPKQAVAIVEAIRTPTCLVVASEGIFSRRPEASALLEQFQNLQIHRLEGGHHLHLEQAAPEVATIIDSFFKSLA
ncbi:alpha/beta hydrolase [Pseudomonas sp. gcc21]|uniref:alpha/beta fold hydrolase n=1 Tax=Pseudomonas sp. gcc21 TaxID=2726989 RepID=UPI0014528E43|nr:alpha/beta hydrolase [Pseudomonas sp. gcc21]QJD58070.1 alpha/beta hydrolase [Pseudomonas sp. gcc21]